MKLTILYTHGYSTKLNDVKSVTWNNKDFTVIRENEQRLVFHGPDQITEIKVEKE